MLTSACPESFSLVVLIAGFTWKGQTAAITQLLTVLISHAADPSQQLLLLAEDVLKEVPGKVPPKETLSPYGGYAALCSATFVTWYKVVLEQLVLCWEKLVAHGQQLIPTAANTARAGRSAQQQALNSQGMLDWDDEQVGQGCMYLSSGFAMPPVSTQVAIYETGRQSCARYGIKVPLQRTAGLQ
eukprot:GHUV01041910.1.p1 GENE.GHUV01041910.1~~GHUV01041910.1.p1  ORF type:complete len:185 (+),score=49.45 GHUV01041910.1:67-621(+)